MTLLKYASLSEKVATGFVRLPFWVQWLIAIAFSLMLYIPILNNSFVSDDFLVIKKLVIAKQLNLDGFFRPLSDISLYITYRLFGKNPAPYYLTGIILHALNALLVFYYCLRWSWTTNKASQMLCALFAGLLFLTYPFHNESVAWILGRGALMANTLGITALLMLTGNAKRVYKILVVCVCYFIGLAAYESIIVLPAMVLVYVLAQKQERRYFALWALVLGTAFLLQMAVRLSASGSITGNYGSGFLKGSVQLYIANIPRVLARIVLPPTDNINVSIALFCIVLSVGIYILFRLWKQTINNLAARSFWIMQVFFLLIVMIVPVMAAVSTRTSESDRFLHFPSYFYCILLAFAITNLIKNHKLQVIGVSVVVCYQVFFLEKNNLNWHKASMAVRETLQIVAERRPEQKLFVVNLPDEIDGAFVFRNGFKEALILHNLDTASVIVVSRLTRDGALTMPRLIQHQKQSGKIFIPPFVLIKMPADNTDKEFQQNGITHIQIPEGSSIVYWNKRNWIRL